MIYLDNSATTRPYDAVMERMSAMMRTCYFNPSAAYGAALAAEREVEEARRRIAQILGAAASGVIFTGGGTESDNLAILGVAETLKHPANFVISGVEHPAVAETAQRVVRLGHEVRVLPVGADGRVLLDRAEALIDAHTALVSCMHVSNETGAIQPVEALAAMLKRANPAGVMHVDGVQAFLRVGLHLKRAGIDCYSLSGHKVHGPKGVGALVLARPLRLIPQMTGGGQEGGLRSGTVDAPAIAGLGEAVRCFGGVEAGEALRPLKLRLLAGLSRLADWQVNGPAPEDASLSAPHILSLSFAGVRGEVLRNALEGAGVLVSTGSACASHKQRVSKTLLALGLTGEQADGTIRVSLGTMNTMAEMDEAAEKIHKACLSLRAYQRR